jgi:TrmH family RNA methyltransferase
MLITSPANERVKLAASLHQKKYRDEHGLFLVEGREMIDMALANHFEAETIFLTASPAQAGVHRAAGKTGPLLSQGIRDMVEVTTEVMQKISKKDNPQDVIAVFKKKLSAAWPVAIDTALPALEEIRDPGNLGTIMRTCHALGLKQILLVGQCCDPYAPETIRASMGSFAYVEIVTATTDELVAWKKNNPSANWIGTDVARATDYREADYTGALLLLGNEQKGLSGTLKSACNNNVRIPMPGGTESLNVAMAATLLLYEARKSAI